MDVIRTEKGRLTEWGWITNDLPESLTAFAPISESIIKELAGHNVKWVESHFSIGWGKIAESPEQERLKKRVALFHKYGIKVLAYMSATNMFVRTMYRDHPEAKKWVQRNAEGAPRPYGGWKVDVQRRFMACLNNPDFVKFQKEIAKKAIEYGYNGLSVDNILHCCYCEVCKEKFAEYTEEQLGAKYEIPVELDWSSPVTRLFAKFCTETIVNFSKELIDAARSVNSDAIFLYNPPISGTKIDDIHFDFSRLNAYVDILFSEDAQLPAIGSLKEIRSWDRGGWRRVWWNREIKVEEKDGQKIETETKGNGLIRNNNIAFYRYLTAAGKGKIGLFHVPHRDAPSTNQLRLGIAEAASCGCILSFLVPPKYDKQRLNILKAAKDYLGFVEKRIEYYEKTELISDTAILYSHSSLYWYLAREKTNDDIYSYSEALVQNNIPFEYIIGDEFTPTELKKYETLILPNCACLSNESVSGIKDFVTQGGNLIVTGDTSLYDEDYNKRKDYGLADTIGISRGAQFTKGEVLKRERKGSRVVYFNDHRLSRYLATFDSKISQELIELVKWSKKDKDLFETKLPYNIQVIPKQKNSQVILHFLNYSMDSSGEPIIQRNLEVNCHGVKAKNVQAYSPDGQTNVDWTTSAEGTEISLASVYIYTIVVIRLT